MSYFIATALFTIVVIVAAILLPPLKVRDRERSINDFLPLIVGTFAVMILDDLPRGDRYTLSVTAPWLMLSGILIIRSIHGKVKIFSSVVGLLLILLVYFSILRDLPL